MSTKITAATINRELARRGVHERLRQGRGYVYFTDGEAHTWFSSSVPVCYVSDLVESTLERTVNYVLCEHAFLRGVLPGAAVRDTSSGTVGRVSHIDERTAEAVVALSDSRGTCGTLRVPVKRLASL